jgi:hypothetical protein
MKRFPKNGGNKKMSPNFFALIPIFLSRVYVLLSWSWHVSTSGTVAYLQLPKLGCNYSLTMH